MKTLLNSAYGSKTDGKRSDNGVHKMRCDIKSNLNENGNEEIVPHLRCCFGQLCVPLTNISVAMFSPTYICTVFYSPS